MSGMVAQISQYSALAAPRSAIPGPASGPRSAETVGFELSGPRTDAANIMAQYDLQAISPREVDALVDSLKASGDYDFGDLWMLETRGERFQSHLAASISEHLGTEIRYDSTAPQNLKASAEAQLGFARLSGAPTQAWETFIAFLDELDQLGGAAQTSATLGHTSQQGHVIEALLRGAVNAA